ncbi:Ionotropic receptor 156 [Frankliniella occidentalis]|nr:Ionotropic receptor 156 [Frankliniella occidentalis]
MDFLVVLALTALLLSTGAPGVLSALAVDDTPVNSPEATSALALLSPYLRSQRTTLIIIGQVNWTSAFLRGLHSEATWVLLPGEDEAVFRKQFDDGVVDNNILAMVVADKPKDPSSWLQNDHVSYARFLFWMTLGPGIEDFISKVPHFLFSACIQPTALAITAPNGSTTLYSVAQQDCGRRAPRLVKVDQWSTSRKSWRQRDVVLAVFGPFCSEWQPPAANRSASVFRQAADGRASLFAELYAISKEKTRLLPWNITITSTISLTSSNFETLTFVLTRAIRQCRLDLAYVEEGFAGRFDTRLAVILPEKKMHPVTVYVPAGLGPAVNPLDAVLVEFSPAVWLGTVLAALFTASALACILRRDRGAALLLALAPLLGQAPGTPPPAGRALRPLLEAGILDHWEDDLDEGNRVLSARHLSALKRVLPLSLQHMAPAFYMLLVGLVVAAVVFAVELATAKLGRARQSPGTATLRWASHRQPKSGAGSAAAHPRF